MLKYVTVLTGAYTHEVEQTDGYSAKNLAMIKLNLTRCHPNGTKHYWLATWRTCNAVECYRPRQMTTTDAKEQNYTGPLHCV